MAGKKHVRLKTPSDVNRFISKLINEVYRGNFDSEKARDIGYLAKILLDSIEKTLLEQRIEDLEKMVEKLISEGPNGSRKEN